MNISISDWQAETLVGLLAEIIEKDYANNSHLQGVYENLLKGLDL